MRTLRLILIVLAWWLGGCASGNEDSPAVLPAVVTLSNPDEDLDIAPRARSYVADGTSTIADATGTDLAEQFSQPGASLEVMRDRGADQWLVLDLRNESPEEDWVLSFRAQFPRADAWVLTCDADHMRCRAPPGAAPVRNGFYVRPEERPLPSMGYAFPLTIARGQAQRVVLRLYVAHREPIEARVAARARYQRQDQLLRLLVYLIIGGMIGSAFYAGFIYVWTRDRPYGWYAGYALMSSGVWISYYSVAHYWIEGLRENQAFTGVAGISALAFALGFHQSFLELERVAPRLRRLIFVELGLALAVIPLTLFTPVPTYKPVAAAVGGIGIVTLLGTAFYCAARRERRARFILAGWIPFLVSGLITSVGVLGVVYVQMGKEIIVVCHGIEMLSLSFALADRIKILSEEREHARARAMRELELRLEETERARQLEAERAQAIAEADRQRTMAHTDALTGLANRLAFDREVRRFAGDPALFDAHAVLVMDVDGLKRLNDSRGHADGDDMLVAFAHELTLRLRETDQIFRLGGDEFVIVIPASERARAEEVASRTREAMESVRAMGFPEVGISVGVAHSDEAANPIEVMELADRRMYEDKERDGRVRRREDRESIVTIAPPPMPES